MLKVSIVFVCDFLHLIIIGSDVTIPVDILDGGTVDNGCCELTGITFKIFCGGDVQLFGVLSMLKQWRNNINYKHIVEFTASIVHGHDR